MKVDFVWTDGYDEVAYDSFAEAQQHREICGEGKVWRRQFDEAGLLFDISDVTDARETDAWT